jgi:hypothetical protein
LDAAPDQQGFQLFGLRLNLAVAPVEGFGTQFQPVERRVTRQRLAGIARLQAILTQRIAFATKHGVQRIAPQVVMVVEVFIAQHQPLKALAEQFWHAMFDVAGIPMIDETVGQIAQDPAVAFPVTQQDATPVTGEVTTPEIDLHFSGA